MRTLTVLPELTNVEDEDSTPIAGRFGSVPNGGDASALANYRSRAVLGPFHILGFADAVTQIY